MGFTLPPEVFCGPDWLQIQEKLQQDVLHASSLSHLHHPHLRRRGRTTLNPLLALETQQPCEAIVE